MLSYLLYRYNLDRFLKLIRNIQNNYDITTYINELKFANRLGLGSEFDINAEYIPILCKFGFGHIEVGTITPKPEISMYELSTQNQTHNSVLAIPIMNKGVENLYQNLKRSETKSVIGISIINNANTTQQNANIDYEYCLQRLYRQSDYFTLQLKWADAAYLKHLFRRVIRLRDSLAIKHQKLCPIYINIPESIQVNIEKTMDLCVTYGVDGIVVSENRVPASNLSLKNIVSYATNNLVVISRGFITDRIEAVTRLRQGADLVQIYQDSSWCKDNFIINIKRAISEYYKEHSLSIS